MNTTKPSDAAMRAAEKVLAKTGGGGWNNAAIKEAAAIIDAELSTPDLEQRAQAAAEEIQRLCGDAIDHHRGLPYSSDIRPIILRHFAGVGTNEGLRESAQEMFDYLIEIGEISKEPPPHDCSSNRWREALAHSTPEAARMELVEALKAAEDCLNPNTDPRDSSSVLAQARAALKHAGERE